MKRPQVQQRLVDEWNATHNVGSLVWYRTDSGQRIQTETREPASLLGGHTAVIWLKGFPGCVSLERVTIYAEKREAGGVAKGKE